MELPFVTKVAWVLENPSDLESWMLVSLPRSGSLRLADTAMIFDSRELDPDEDYPPEASALELRTVVGGPSIQDVLSNLSQQRPNPDIEKMLDALNYYLEHDAFISLQ